MPSFRLTRGRFFRAGAGFSAIITLAAALFLTVPTARAQSNTGTTIGLFTLIDPSARSAAMGCAGGASADEAMSAFYNPGALGAMRQSDVQFTYNAWFADITLNYVFAAIHLGDAGTASVSLTQLSSGDIDVRTVDFPLGTGERYNVSDMQVGVGYGIKVTDRFYFGLQANYVSERIWHTSTAVFGLSLGTLYELSSDGLKIGASLVNFGTRNHFSGSDLQIRYDVDPARYGDNSAIPGSIATDDFSLPVVFRVALGYPLRLDESNVVNFALDALHPSDNSESMNVGAEWSFRRIFALRVGYQSLFQTDSEVGLTAGAGVVYDGGGYDFRFDYAWATHQRLGAVHRVTLGFGF